MRSARNIHHFEPELEILIRHKEHKDNAARVWIGVFILFCAAMLITGGPR